MSNGIPTIVCGQTGRMAGLLAQAVEVTEDLVLAGRVSLRERGALRAIGGEEPVVVDFTAREATELLLREAVGTPCSLVIGTSGLTGADRDLMRDLSRKRAVLHAANFSPSLAVARRFIRELAAGTDHTWSAGVVDIHFAGKRDAPSATALALAEEWRGHRTAPAGRDIASFRMGDAVSEHRFLAGGAGEQVEICHRVNDRKAFAPGVIAAVRFVHRADPGLYTLEDALCH